MKAIRIFALTALSLIGLTAASAQAGEWHRRIALPVCPPPVVICAPAPCPAVVAPTVIRPVHYHPAVICKPRVVYHHGRR